MVAQSILLGCLLLAANDGAADEIAYMNTNEFKIPINIAVDRREIKELILYLSTNNGQTWNPTTPTVTPDKEAFPFTARNDGSHWFAVQVAFKTGKREPQSLAQARIMKVVVDTINPIIHLQADRLGEKIAGRWQIDEKNPEPVTLKLEYQTAEMTLNKTWYQVGIEPHETGEFDFTPQSSSAVKVRMTFRDKAGNQGMNEVTVAPAIQPASNSGPPSGPGNNPGWGGGTGNQVQKPLLDTQPLPPPPAQPPTPLQPTQPLQPSHPISRAVGVTPGMSAPGAVASGPGRPLMVVNRPLVKVGFDVTRCGPSGLGSVDVYLSTDDGQSWKKTQADELLAPPSQADPQAVGSLQAGVVTVKLPQQEGPYGIYLVAKSKVGVGLPPPRQGTIPQLRVELDTTFPEAELHLPMPDTTRDNVLIFQWTATDHHLDRFPITLEYSEAPGGPWKPIGPPALPNTGRYDWQVTGDVPGKVYLKLTVRDQVGNLSQAVTQQPVIVDPTPPTLENINIIRVGP